MDKTSIGDRMKLKYEMRSRTFLTGRTPVIVRLDGKAFLEDFKSCFKNTSRPEVNGYGLPRSYDDYIPGEGTEELLKRFEKVIGGTE